MKFGYSDINLTEKNSKPKGVAIQITAVQEDFGLSIGTVCVITKESSFSCNVLFLGSKTEK